MMTFSPSSPLTLPPVANFGPRLFSNSFLSISIFCNAVNISALVDFGSLIIASCSSKNFLLSLVLVFEVSIFSNKSSIFIFPPDISDNDSLPFIFFIK